VNVEPRIYEGPEKESGLGRIYAQRWHDDTCSVEVFGGVPGMGINLGTNDRRGNLNRRTL